MIILGLDVLIFQGKKSKRDPTKDMLSVGTSIANDSLPFRAVYDMYYLPLNRVQY